MVNNTGIERLSFRYYNGTATVGDAIPGGSVAGYTNQPNQYGGQVGATILLSNTEASRRSDPAVTQILYTGRYQYVQFAADGTNYAVGQILYWKDETAHVVTNVAPTATAGRVAGVCIASVTQGNYWLVQTEGLVYVQYRATVTDATAEDLVVVVVNTNTADALADATAVTDTVLKRKLGVAKDLPANAALGRVLLTGLAQI